MSVPFQDLLGHPLQLGDVALHGDAEERAFEQEVRDFIAANLTPDEHTGIGIWTEDMFVRALRTGRLDNEEWSQLTDAIGRLNEARIHKADGKVVRVLPRHVHLRDVGTDYQSYDPEKQLIITFPSLEVGDTIEVPVDTTKLYGERDESLVFTDRIENVPEEYRELGMTITMENDKGEPRNFIVTRLDDKTLTIDGNNPLCGRKVTFVLEVLTVRDATEEEIELGGPVGLDEGVEQQLEVQDGRVAQHRERPLVRVRDERDPVVLDDRRPLTGGERVADRRQVPRASHADGPDREAGMARLDGDAGSRLGDAVAELPPAAPIRPPGGGSLLVRGHPSARRGADPAGPRDGLRDGAASDQRLLPRGAGRVGPARPAGPRPGDRVRAPGPGGGEARGRAGPRPGYGPDGLRHRRGQLPTQRPRRSGPGLLRLPRGARTPRGLCRHPGEPHGRGAPGPAAGPGRAPRPRRPGGPRGDPRGAGAGGPARRPGGGPRGRERAPGRRVGDAARDPALLGGGGWRIGAGLTVAMPSLRAEAIDGSWSAESETGASTPPYLYASFAHERWAAGVAVNVPFGGGVRRCLGANFAQIEMKVVLATVLRAMRLRAVDEGDVIDVGGGRRLEVMYAPGHARHHMAVQDSESGVLFVGDSMGV